MNINEKYRAECEARYWLGRGYTTKAMTNQLSDEIAKKRGIKAANYLIENMRKVYRKQMTKQESINNA